MYQFLKSIFLYWILFLTGILYSQSHITTESLGSHRFLVHCLTPSAAGLGQQIIPTEQGQVTVLSPVRNRILLLSSSPQLDYQVRSEEIETLTFDKPVRFVEDIPIGLADSTDLSSRFLQWDSDVVRVKRLGQQDGKWLFLVHFQSLNGVNQGATVRWLTRYTIEMHGDNIEVVKDSKQHRMLLSTIQLDDRSDRAFGKRSAIPDANMFQFPPRFPRLKILISKEGWYVIPQPMVVQAGWDVRAIDARRLRIVGRFGEIPIVFRGESDGSFDFTDAVEFWGEPLWDEDENGDKRLDPFSVQNVYWLELGETDGLRYAQEEAVASAIPGTQKVYPRSFPDPQHFEKDLSFHRLGYVLEADDADHWFINTAIAGGTKYDYPYTLQNPDPFSLQMPTLRVKLRGHAASLTQNAVDVYLNDQFVATAPWAGYQEITLESEPFSPSYLEEGENTLTIVNRAEEGVLAPVFLDWFELTYPRQYVQSDSLLRFFPPQYSSGKTCHFQIDGFSEKSIEIFKVGISRIMGASITPVVDTLGVTTHRLEFEDDIVREDAAYLAVSPAGKSLPDSVAFVEDPGLLAAGLGADYTVVVPADSLGEDPLSELVQLRESQGLRVQVVQLQDLYDTFSNGIPNPEAIRSFLVHARRNWNPAPRFLLLVGDGYLNNRAINVSNLIPVKLAQTTKFGAAASDHFYTLLEGDDDLPDIAVGRLPVSTVSDLQSAVSKIVAYEQSPPDAWKNQYLLIGAAGHDNVFRWQSEQIIRHQMEPDYTPDRLYLSGNPSDPNVGGTEDLLRKMRDGRAWINFRGHGGGAIWSDAGLLDLDDLPLLENRGKLPIVTSMTCFTCDFASSRLSLGEGLVLQKETGAVAILGATGVGWVWNDYYFLQELILAMQADPAATLGECIRRAKTAYLLTHGGDLPRSEVYQYTLLGDPATRLPFPKQALAMSLPKRSYESGDVIQISGETSDVPTHLKLDLTRADHSTSEQMSQMSPGPKWQQEMQIPPHFQDKEGGIRAQVWNSETGFHAHGFIDFTVGSAFFDSLCVFPASPTSDDSLRFAVTVDDIQNVNSVWCRLLTPYPDTLAMQRTGPAGRYVTVNAIGPLDPGDYLSFAFLVENQAGVSSGSDTVRLSIPTRADPMMRSISLTGTDQVNLTAQINNWGGESAQQVIVRFVCPQTAFIADDTVTIKSFIDTVVCVPFSPPLGEVDVTVILDPDSAANDQRRENNTMSRSILVNRFNVTPELGAILGSAQPDTVGLPGKVLMSIPPGGVSRSSALCFEISESAEGFEQISVSLPAIMEDPPLLKDAVVDLISVAADSLRPYRWDQQINRWVMCPHERLMQRLRIKTRELGLFRLMRSDDTAPPLVHIQVDQQPLADGSYVPKSPTFSVVLEDLSGIRLAQDQLTITLDDAEQPRSSLTFPDSTGDPTRTVVLFRPLLTPGEHTLSVRAIDVHGNVCQTETVRFRVETRLSIQFLGNHPNPFKRETTFVYVLTDAAQHASLKIYTVSGRLVRTFDDADLASPDYHEVQWDGTDTWGDDVANGVYFFQIKAQGQNGRDTVRGKIAKIQ